MKIDMMKIIALTLWLLVMIIVLVLDEKFFRDLAQFMYYNLVSLVTLLNKIIINNSVTSIKIKKGKQTINITNNYYN